MNAASLAVLALIALIVAGAVAHLANNRRKGKSDCGCGCGRCDGCAGPNEIGRAHV